jgi:threonylcarbamoyladenosine tRNA methylthiotransferase MtaB
VTGCAAQLSPGAYRPTHEVDAVELRDLSVAPKITSEFRGRVRSFVEVQTGCDHRCTFCTIRHERGPSLSLPFELIRDRVKRELDAGACEIVLTGVDITSNTHRLRAGAESRRGSAGILIASRRSP